MRKHQDQNLYSRRGFLRAGMSLGFCGISSNTLAALAEKAEQRLSFYNLHTGETFSRPYRVDGNYIPSALSEINQLLRDFRTGEVGEIDTMLLDSLYGLSLTIDVDKSFHVISGYRSPKTNAMLAKTGSGVAKQSLHVKGMAIDVRLPGCDLERLRDAAMEMRLGGVGYYPKSDFVHLDTGRVRFW